MALFRGIQEYIALDANNITLVFDSGNIVNISGNIFLYPPQGHPILYNYCNIIVSCCLSRPNFLAIRWVISVLYTCGDHDQLYRMPFLDKHINDMLLFIQACITLNQLLSSL